MASPLVHPRRRSLKGSSPAEVTSSSSTSSPGGSSCHKTTLKKGATFHSPTSPSSEEHDPILNIPSLPRRSPTSSRALQDTVAAGERRMAELLDSFDRSFSRQDAGTADSQATLRQEDLPVPRGILEAHLRSADVTDVDACQFMLDTIDLEPHHHSRHLSDSGLGSSISDATSSLDCEVKMAQDALHQLRNPTSSTKQRTTRSSTRSSGNASQSQSAITRSIASTTTTTNNDLNEHLLGQYARKQIERCIIRPILREKRLEPFHPLVKGLPQRIGQREITCLRDLEKTLIFLAPVSSPLRSGVGVDAYYVFCALKKYSATKTAYLNFCETSIQCIHTAVEHLNDRDQRRPTDRPYTNGYFLDLVEQVRQYAGMMAVARAHQEASRQRGGREEDFSADEELTLEGGLSQTGRPAELVRKKKGKAISLRTGDAYEQPDSPTTGMKRSLSEQTSDDSVLRSMARRKKNAPKEPAQLCPTCNKEFKRPCDLTKHEKTHSRPWKCPHKDCKYHELGWPTEKECQRHQNDRHSREPAMFKCSFPPCTYSSKRESNCKQHMEKTHGWTYHRSKNNGRNGKRPVQQTTPQTPITNMTPQSHTVEMPTPVSDTTPSPYEPFVGYAGTYSVTDSTGPSEDFTFEDDSALMDGPTHVPDVSMNDIEYDFDAFQRHLETSDPDAFVGPNPVISAMMNAEAGPSNYDPPSMSDAGLNNFDWPSMDNDFTSFNAQMVTPAASTELRPFHDFSNQVSMPTAGNHVASLSPHGQGNLMLYAPESENEFAGDDGFEDFAGDNGKPTGDFSLFGNSNGTSSMSSVNDTTMFPPLANTYNGQYVGNIWASRGAQVQYPSSQLGIDDFMGDVHEE